MTGGVAMLTVVGGILPVTISVTFAFLLFTGEAPVQAVNGGWLPTSA